jgi:arginine repressor
MKYFKNTQVAQQYSVSKDTVAKWIQESFNQKNELEIYSNGKRSYIVNSETNHLILNKLADRARKFRNTRYCFKVVPHEEFSEHYNLSQQIEIINNIILYNEVPVKFVYLGNGAKSWDLYAQQLKTQNSALYRQTLELLKLAFNYISTIERYRKFSLIDIGPGNAESIKEFITELLVQNRLESYVGLDISPDLLNISQKNITQWFGEKLKIEGNLLDITKDIFLPIAYSSCFGSKTSNLITYLGSTIENDKYYAHQLSVIARSMLENDIFLLEQSIANEAVKKRLTFGIRQAKYKEIDEDLMHRTLVLDLLGIPKKTYFIERFFSPEHNARIIQACFKYDVSVTLTINDMIQCIHFTKGSRLVFWRHNCHTQVEVINTLALSGFQVLSSFVSSDEESLLAICKVNNTKSDLTLIR